MLCQGYQISHYALNPKIMQNKAKILALKRKTKPQNQNQNTPYNDKDNWISLIG